MPDLRTGELVGGYELGTPLGESERTAVFLATEVLIEGRVVLKIARSPEGRARLARQAEAQPRLADLCGDAVVRILDASLDEDPGFLVLADTGAAPARGPLPGPEARALLLEVARALAPAHRTGQPHGALKASNVLVSRGGRARLTDPERGPGALQAASDPGAVARALRADVASLGGVYRVLRGLPDGEAPASPEVRDERREADALDERVLALCGSPDPKVQAADADALARRLPRLDRGRGLVARWAGAGRGWERQAAIAGAMGLAAAVLVIAALAGTRSPNRSEPRAARADAAPPNAAASSGPAEPTYDVIVLAADGADLVPTLLVARDPALLTATRSGRIERRVPPDWTVANAVDLGAQVSSLALSSGGLCVCLPARGQVVVLDARSLEESARVDVEGAVSLAAQPSAPVCFAATRDGDLVAVDAARGEPLRRHGPTELAAAADARYRLAPGAEPPAYLRDPVLVRGGRALVAVSDRSLHRLAALGGHLRLEETSPPVTGPVVGLAGSPDGRVVVPLGGSGRPGDLVPLFGAGALDGPAAHLPLPEVHAIAFDDRSGRLLTHGADGHLLIFDARGTLDGTIALDEGRPRALAFLPGGRGLLLLTDRALVWVKDR